MSTSASGTADQRSPGAQRRRVSTLLAVAIALPFLTSILAAALAASQQRTLEAAMAELGHVLEVRRVAQGVLAQLLDLESSQRGYVLTTRGEFLESFGAAKDRVPEGLERLTRLVGNDAALATQVSELARIAGARVVHAGEIVQAVREGRRDEARALVDAGRGRELTDQARALVDALDGAQEQLLLSRQGHIAQASLDQSRYLSALVGASAVALAVLILVVKRLLAYEDVVKMCAWSRTIEYEGQWLSFEQYLAKRFGIQTAHGISPDAARRVREGMTTEDAVPPPAP